MWDVCFFPRNIRITPMHFEWLMRSVRLVRDHGWLRARMSMYIWNKWAENVRWARCCSFEYVLAVLFVSIWFYLFILCLFNLFTIFTDWWDGFIKIDQRWLEYTVSCRFLPCRVDYGVVCCSLCPQLLLNLLLCPPFSGEASSEVFLRANITNR